MYLLLKVDGYAAAPFILTLTTSLLCGTLTLSTIMWRIPWGLYLLKREIFQQFLFSTLMCVINFVSINGGGMRIQCQIYQVYGFKAYSREKCFVLIKHVAQIRMFNDRLYYEFN